MSDCLFCKIVNKEIPADIVYETDAVLAFKDIAPQAPFHVLVIPKKHIASINDMTAEDTEVMGELFLAAKIIAAENGFTEDGYRVVMNTGEKAGQTVFHAHLHILAGRPFTWPPG